MESKYSGRLHVLPVGHKEDSQGINVGLHDLDLSAYQGFLLGRTSEECVAVCGRFRCGCYIADQLRVPVRLSSRELCKSQDEYNRPHSDLHFPPSAWCYRRTWHWP